MLIINKPRLVLRLQWACFGGLVGRQGLLMIEMFSEPDYITRPCLVLELPCLVSTYISFYIIEIPTVIAASKGKVSDIEEFI